MAGFLLYDSETQKLVVLAASQLSTQLKPVKAIHFSLDNPNQLPRDVYNSILLDFGKRSFLIFQRANLIACFTLGDETSHRTWKALPRDMHLSHYKLYFVTRNQKGTFDIKQIDFSKKCCVRRF